MLNEKSTMIPKEKLKLNSLQMYKKRDLYFKDKISHKRYMKILTKYPMKN